MDDEVRSDVDTGPVKGRFTRTQLIRRAGAAGAVVALPGVLTEKGEAASEAAQIDGYRWFTAAEAAAIGAFVDRLIPSDAATGPGAKEANVLRYIDWALAGALPMFRDAYGQAVVGLDNYARAKYGTIFAGLTTAQQDAVLTDMDTNKATGFAPNAKAVFEMIRTHAVQGMFGDPAHGGNVGFVGWKLVRFPGPRLSITAADQRINANPKSSMRSTYSIPLFKTSKKGSA
jgi:gluconate 2-dehydrogenase gamma chain